jgi:hypothetical protein
MPQVVFPDCTAYMAQFFDKAALAIVPELDLRIAKPSPEALLEAVREATAIVPFSHGLLALREATSGQKAQNPLSRLHRHIR